MKITSTICVSVFLTLFYILSSSHYSNIFFCIYTFIFINIVNHTRIFVRMVIYTSSFYFMASLMIHGFLNPSFQTSGVVILGLPVRLDGVDFAFVGWAWITAFMAVSAFCLAVDRRQIVYVLQRLPLPEVLTTVLLQSMSAIWAIERAAANILLAQKARGVYQNRGLFSRARNILRVFIPLVTVLIKESERRALIQDLLQSTDIRRIRMNVKLFDVREGLIIMPFMTPYIAIPYLNSFVE